MLKQNFIFALKGKLKE